MMNQMMHPMMNAQLQSQWAAGVSLGQRGVAAEAMGNLPLAVQCYQQAAACMQQSIFTARQCGSFAPDSVHAGLAHAHMSAARTMTASGHPIEAWQHVQYALMALNQAIMQNPLMPAYHAAAGTIMMAMGNLPEAERAFCAVQQIVPGESHSLQMLNSLRAQRGATSPRFPDAAGWPGAQTQMRSGANAPPAWPASPHAAPQDWSKTIKNVCDAANAIMGTVSKFETMARQFG